jgi:hypothetical protein
MLCCPRRRRPSSPSPPPSTSAAPAALSPGRSKRRPSRRSTPGTPPAPSASSSPATANNPPPLGHSMGSTVGLRGRRSRSMSGRKTLDGEGGVGFVGGGGGSGSGAVRKYSGLRLSSTTAVTPPHSSTAAVASVPSSPLATSSSAVGTRGGAGEGGGGGGGGGGAGDELGEASLDFVGSLGRTAAEDRLRGQPPFTFVLRLSSQGGYCVSFVTKGGDRCEHALIQRGTSEGGYRLGVYKKEFPRIPDLLRYYGFTLTADANGGSGGGSGVVYEILLPDEQPSPVPLHRSTPGGSGSSGSRVSTRSSSRRRPSRVFLPDAGSSSPSTLRSTIRRTDSIDITQQARYVPSADPAALPSPPSTVPTAAVNYSTLAVHDAVTTRVLRSSDGMMSAANFDRLEPGLRVSETSRRSGLRG